MIERVLAGQRADDRLHDWKATIVWLARAQGREIRDGEPPADLAVWLIGPKRWRQLSSTGEVPQDVAEPYHPE